MKSFEIKGKVLGMKERPFTKIIKAKNKEDAKDYAYCLIGGKEKIPRRKIIVDEVSEAK